MRFARVLFLPAFAACLSAAALSAECEEKDSRAFLEANDLKQYNVHCINYLCHLLQNKPERAAEIHMNSSHPKASEESKEEMRSLATGAAAVLIKANAEDIELVAAHRLSSKAVVLCYVLNTEHGPKFVAFGAYRHEGKWYSKSWDWRSEFREILEYLRGAIRFREPASFPVKPVEGRTV